MAKLAIKPGSTSVLVRIFIQDSTSSVGAGKTGLTATSFTSTKVGIARDDDGNAGATQVTLSNSTKGTWTSGGIVEKDSTFMPGLYEFGLTNASIAAGSRSCEYQFIGTGIVPCLLEIDLGNDANVTLWNGTAVSSPATAGIPDVNVKNINNVTAATAGAPGGVFIAGANAPTSITGTSNSAGLTLTGNGTGPGLLSTGGTTGHGWQIVGGGTSGDGINITTTSGHGINVAPLGQAKHGLLVTGSGNSLGAACDAARLVGGFQGIGLHALGGTNSGEAIKVEATAGNSNGITILGFGTGHGILSTSGSGATGDGFRAHSAATAGDGFSGTGNGTGVGFRSAAAAVGFGGGSVVIKKNTALAAFMFYMALASDNKSPALGLTITSTVALDGAAFGATANSAVEMTGGWYKIDLAAADLNGDTVALEFTGPGANPTLFSLATQS